MLNISLYSSLVSRYFIFISLMLLMVSVYSQTNSLLIQEIDKALQNNCLDETQTSVSVVALPTREVIYAYNPKKPLLPASVMKILTTAAALYYLGPEYRFKTQFLHTGKRKKGVLHGDLIIRGGGDPRLSTEHFWYIATQIKESGINKITGNLVIDTHFFDEHDLAPGWDEEERTQRSYDAKLGALSLNFNSIAVHVQPGSYVGDTLRAWLYPAPAYIYLHNDTGKTIKRGRTTVWAHRREKFPGKVEMWLKGQLPLSVREKVIYLNIDNPTRYAAETFRALLTKADITINGETKVVAKPIAANKLYEHLSPALSLILKELNTFSNNFTAEQIVKTIAAERFGTPGSHAEGLRLIRDFLRISGVSTEGIVLVDGSGLSRKNLLTTQTLTDLLATMYLRFDIGPDFIAALRIMGKNGILSQRLANSPVDGKIRAKTGTLKGVSTLAGYVASAKGKIFAYALFLANNRCGYRGSDQIEDRIVVAIHKFGDLLVNKY